MFAFLEYLRHGLLAVNGANSISQERSHRQLDNLGVLLRLGREGNGVQNHHLLKDRFRDILVGSLAEQTMGSESEHTASYTVMLAQYPKSNNDNNE